MNWDDLRGHGDQVTMLRRSIARGRLAHAYLFAGPAGVGKSRFARIFAQCLFCERHTDEELLTCGECSGCKQMQAASHPDFFFVGCPEGKGEIPVAVFYGSGDKRGKEGLIHDLSLRPMAGSRRVAIIDDANKMNDEGANGMLKTLEEPPPNSLLILIAENLDAVLPTIRSRCQLLRFGALATEDVADLLVESELTTDTAEASAVAAMSEGSLQTAAQLLNPTLRNLREQLYGFLSEPDMKPLDAAKTLTSGLDEIGGDTHEQRRGAGWLVRFAQEFYRQSVLLLSGIAASDATIPTEVQRYAQRLQSQGLGGTELAMDLFDRCVLAENHIDWNVNPGKAIESLFDDLARTSRSRQSLAVR
ncbi:MAG: DNA polymerase III subunit delta' [Planctomycetota bacterium]|jgi:DNA polymerase-3 subunit delta'